MSQKKGNSYRNSLGIAYQNGYRAGWQSYEDVPHVFGSKTAAKHGFSNGYTRHKKSDAYIARSKMPERYPR